MKEIKQEKNTKIHKTHVKCPKCYCDNVTDHEEFGLPGGYRYKCHECDYLWGKL